MIESGKDEGTAGTEQPGAPKIPHIPHRVMHRMRRRAHELATRSYRHYVEMILEKLASGELREDAIEDFVPDDLQASQPREAAG